MTKEEFSALMLRYDRLVYTICFQLVQNAASAEDLTQETFLSAYVHRDSCPAGYERQWLGRIAANKAKDFLQSAWNRHNLPMGEQHELPGLACGAEEEVVGRWGAREITRQIDALRQPYRQICRLALLEEKSPQEIALLLGRPLKTIHTQLLRGKALLRRQLERSEQDGNL